MEKHLILILYIWVTEFSTDMRCLACFGAGKIQEEYFASLTHTLYAAGTSSNFPL